MLNKYCNLEIVRLIEQYTETRAEKLFDILFDSKELHINEIVGHIALKSKLISFTCDLCLTSYVNFSTFVYTNTKELLNDKGTYTRIVMDKLKIINEFRVAINSMQVDIFCVNIKLSCTIKCKLIENIFPHDVVMSIRTCDCDKYEFENNKILNCVGDCDIPEIFIFKEYNKNRLFTVLQTTNN
jgi:hypothetical protein